MKSLLKLAAVLLLFLSTTVKSQEAKDSATIAKEDECKIKYSLYYEYYKNKNYKDAFAPWLEIYKTCPSFSKNIYIHGGRILKNQIKNDTINQEKYKAQLMEMYDTRIKHFNNEGFVRGLQGVDMIKLYKTKYKEAYDILDKSITLSKEKAQINAIIYYMQLSTILYKKKELEKEKVFENYITLSDIVTLNIEKINNSKYSDEKKEKMKKNYNKANQYVDKFFFEGTDIADCENLQNFFGTKLSEKEEELKLAIISEDTVKMNKAKDEFVKVARKSLKYLNKKNCTDSDLYLKVLKVLLKESPNATAAIGIAKRLAKAKEFTEAEKYYKQAIELQEDKEKKADYYLGLARIQLATNKFGAARSSANKALEYKSNFGQAHILIAKAYVSGGCSDYKGSAKYWAAVDRLIKAKSVDASVAGEANRLIGRYSSGYPKKEDVFFNGHQVGQTYSLKCWIGGTTTIRAR